MKNIAIVSLIFSCFYVLNAQTIKTGVATYFDDLGKPYGGCGVPESIVETPNYVALNVFDTPGSGTQYVRPLTGNNLQYMGEFSNGNNCGRWLKVTILDNCVGGQNDGALGLPLCRGTYAVWQQDKYYGSTLNMIVTDACGDGNGWCRDHPYHLDLHTTSLDNFEKNGQKSTGMYPTYFNNRKVQWEYIEAPNYTGDVKIHMMQAAQRYYAPILITNLKNGIHKVEQKVNGNWVNVPKNGDMGQAYILPDLISPYTIRIYDANDLLVNNGREYTFAFPASCGTTCSSPTTEVNYTTFDPNVTLDSDERIYGQSNIQVVKNNGTYELLLSSLPNQNLDIKLYGLSGKQIAQYETFNNKDYELSNLQKGFYIILVYASNRLLANSKICIIE